MKSYEGLHPILPYIDKLIQKPFLQGKLSIAIHDTSFANVQHAHNDNRAISERFVVSFATLSWAVGWCFVVFSFGAGKIEQLF